LFSIIPVVLKVNATQEAYPMKKGLFLDGFPSPGLTLKLRNPVVCAKPLRSFSLQVLQDFNTIIH